MHGIYKKYVKYRMILKKVKIQKGETNASF